MTTILEAEQLSSETELQAERSPLYAVDGTLIMHPWVEYFTEEVRHTTTMRKRMRHDGTSGYRIPPESMASDSTDSDSHSDENLIENESTDDVDVLELQTETQTAACSSL